MHMLVQRRTRRIEEFWTKILHQFLLLKLELSHSHPLSSHGYTSVLYSHICIMKMVTTFSQSQASFRIGYGQFISSSGKQHLEFLKNAIHVNYTVLYHLRIVILQILNNFSFFFYIYIYVLGLGPLLELISGSAVSWWCLGIELGQSYKRPAPYHQYYLSIPIIIAFIYMQLEHKGIRKSLLIIIFINLGRIFFLFFLAVWSWDARKIIEQ